MRTKNGIYLLVCILGVIIWGCAEEEPPTLMAPEQPVIFVDSVFPADSSYNVSIYSPVLIAFLGPMDTASYISSRFFINSQVGHSMTADQYGVRFNPLSHWEENTLHEVEIKAGLRDTAGNIMPADYTFEFTTGFSSLQIDSIYPVNRQTQVPLDVQVAVKFATDMDPATITSSTFYIESISGSVTYADSLAIFTPSDSLGNNAQYTVVIEETVSTADGTTLRDDFVWEFFTLRTDTTGPALVAFSPSNGATAIGVGDNIVLEFSEELENTGSLTNMIEVSAGSEQIYGNTTLDSNIITLDPTLLFPPSTEITVSINDRVEDLFDNEAPIITEWSFTTAPASTIPELYPLNGDMNVSTDEVMSATFITDVNEVSLNEMTFYLTEINTGRKVPGVISYINQTAVFTPAEDLIIGYFYRLTRTENVTYGPDVSIGLGQSATFCVEPGVLMPLAIGNTWNYDTDTVVIVRDTIIDNEIWYIDQKDRRYINRVDGLALENDFTLFPFEIEQAYPDSIYQYEKAIIGSDTVNVINREYTYGGPGYLYYFYFTPGLGITRIRTCEYQGWGQYDCSDRRNLVSYEFVE